MTRPDHELLEAWRAGDKRAGSELIDRKHAFVVRFFRNKVAVICDERDLVQHTFASLVEAVGRLDDEKRFDAFLFGIARNVLLEYIRRKSRRMGPGLSLDELCVADMDNPSVTSITGLRQELRLLAQSLRKVTLFDQTLLELRFFEGATAARISELTGVPRGSVDGRLRRALDRLRAAMELCRQSESWTGPALDSEDFARWAEEIREHLPAT